MGTASGAAELSSGRAARKGRLCPPAPEDGRGHPKYNSDASLKGWQTPALFLCVQRHQFLLHERQPASELEHGHHRRNVLEHNRGRHTGVVLFRLAMVDAMGIVSTPPALPSTTVKRRSRACPEFLPFRPSVTLRLMKRKNPVWTGKSRRDRWHRQHEASASMIR